MLRKLSLENFELTSADACNGLETQRGGVYVLVVWKCPAFPFPYRAPIIDKGVFKQNHEIWNCTG
jgi:hypothetical protein